jgi:exo-beta-1,3-glucanase (GH17 family)
MKSLLLVFCISAMVAAEASPAAAQEATTCYTAAGPVQFALQQRPEDGSCRVPRQMQVKPRDLHEDWYFPRNWTVWSMART